MPIEKWHAVMSPLAMHYRSIRDYKAIDGIAAGMPRFYKADEFARTYGDVMKTCKPHGWQLPNPDIDKRYFTEVTELSKRFDKLLDKMRKFPAKKNYEIIESPIFGKYPARLLALNVHDCTWPSSGSRQLQKKGAARPACSPSPPHLLTSR